MDLVVSPDGLSAALPVFKDLLKDYKFISGEKYAEYRPGDKLAKYGLAALITGGAAAAAVKLGLFGYLALFFKKIGKLVIILVVGVAAFFKRLYARLTGRRETP